MFCKLGLRVDFLGTKGLLWLIKLLNCLVQERSLPTLLWQLRFANYVCFLTFVFVVEMMVKPKLLKNSMTIYLNDLKSFCSSIKIKVYSFDFLGFAYSFVDTKFLKRCLVVSYTNPSITLWNLKFTQPVAKIYDYHHFQQHLTQDFQQLHY